MSRHAIAGMVALMERICRDETKGEFNEGYARVSVKDALPKSYELHLAAADALLALKKYYSSLMLE